MAEWDKMILCSFVIMLTVFGGTEGQSVNYPPPVCAVAGSTLTILCTFTSNSIIIQEGKEVQIRISRVRWCQNHLICHGPTPSVYDSLSLRSSDPRYRYLGDLQSNCTLQISNIKKKDEGTLRFRMEADKDMGHFTGQSGVSITVMENTQLRIQSSAGNRDVTVGETITLSCSAACSFDQLEVTWFRGNHTLSESGPVLLLSPLTAEDSGNYTCALRTNKGTSAPYRLRVKEEQEGTDGGPFDVMLIIRVILFTLHSLLLIIVSFIIIHRTILTKKGSAEERLSDLVRA
ncbi:uncharacterized protein LOC141801362 [Halichoeres trimaculatus]|uniref:uncharacterized protein LOC141801362 n=1 Tax=Halichoeres trimaculatus TaxID=147232 RepID=UPI003D9EA5E3